MMCCFKPDSDPLRINDESRPEQHKYQWVESTTCGKCWERCIWSFWITCHCYRATPRWQGSFHCCISETWPGVHLMLGNCNLYLSNFKRNHPQTRLRHSPSTSQHNVSRWIILHWRDVPLEGWNNLYIVACSFPSYHRILPFLASGGSALTATSDGFPLDCQAVLVHPENTAIQYWRYMGNTQLCDYATGSLTGHW